MTHPGLIRFSPGTSVNISRNRTTTPGKRYSIGGFKMTDSINALMSSLSSYPLATAPKKDTTVAGGGLVNTQWSVDNTSTTNQLTATDARTTTTSQTTTSTFFAPSSVSYTIPIITISGSQVSETGNTTTAQPTSYTATTQQEASATSKPSTDISSSAKAGSEGLDLTSLIVPVAVIAGVAVLGTSLIGAVFD